MFSFTAILLMACIYSIIGLEDYYSIRVIENNQTVEQKVWFKKDLQIIEVPAHGQRQHIIVYLDEASGHQMIKFVDLDKCQLSVTDMYSKKNVPISAASKITNMFRSMRTEEFTPIRLLKLEHEQPIQNISGLRAEIHEACKGLPIFWADSIEEHELSDMAQRNEAYMTHDYVTVPADLTQRESGTRGGPSSCNPTGIIEPSDERFKCHQNCLYQKCKMTGPQGSTCWWIVTCHMVGVSGQQCLLHAITTNGYCKPCCEDPNSPRCNTNYFIRHCDCLQW